MPKIDFLGKGDVAGHHLAVPFHDLTPHQDKSVGKVDMSGNLILHGDNLLALKALLPYYAAQVKCIYIDPPYNTGNEAWVYSDKVNSPLIQAWQKKTVDRDDQCRHDKWLCMMWPRLNLLRELLADDGVIFISIDDNEQHHLRAIMDEIFGEENYAAQFVWQDRLSIQNDTDLSQNHEYIISYAKNRRFENRRLKESNINTWFTESSFAFLPLPLDKDKFSNPDNDPRGPWSATPFDAPNIRPNLTYEIVNPNTGTKHLPPEGRHWRFEKETYKKMLADNKVLFGRSGDSRPQLKIFYEERKLFGSISNSWLDGKNYETTTSATKALEVIFQKKYAFDNPKPVELIKHLLKISTQQNDIVLDSFAGSGTTAHAVLALNKEDDGNRKFILVECEDYADAITAERVRRVIKGVPEAKDEALKKGLGGSFTYVTLGDEIDAEKILSGDAMPSWETLARHVFWLATSVTLTTNPTANKAGFVGTHKDAHIYLLYQPDTEFMQSDAAILTGNRADALGAKHKGERIVVYAAAAYISQKDMKERGIVFCQLPWAITKRIGGVG